MVLQMTFDQLGHQPVQGAAAGGYQLKNIFALARSFERPLDCFDLTLNPSGSGNHRGFVFGGV